MMRSSSGRLRQGEEEIREPHERGVHAAARGAGHGADDYAHDDRDQHRGQPDRDRDAAAVACAQRDPVPDRRCRTEAQLEGPCSRALKSISLMGTGHSHGLVEDGR